jgi:hypothetical protein
MNTSDYMLDDDWYEQLREGLVGAGPLTEGEIAACLAVLEDPAFVLNSMTMIARGRGRWE